MKNIITNQTYSHAYAFEGKDGIGKLLLANEFAKAILGVNNLETSADYTLIDKKEDKKDIVVEQIRDNVINNVYERPSNGDKKVYVINNAHFLNAQAQNALLKTLEEPPEYVIIILICQRIEAFLPTIISRINRIHFDGINDELLKSYIKEKYDADFSDNVIEYFGGSIGNAISIIESKVYDKFEKIDELIEKITSGNKLESFILAQSIDFKEDNVLEYIEYRIYKMLEERQASEYVEGIKEIESAKLKLKRNGNYDIVIDSMIINLCKRLGAKI